MADLQISLHVASSLALATKLLSDEGRSMSRAQIRNWTGLSEDILWPALEHGCTLGCLQWEAGNFYKLKKLFVVPEAYYYLPITKALEGLWLNDKFQIHEFQIENTSRRDSKIVGPWTRPDLTLVSNRRFPWTVGSEFDVVTFEIKRPENCDVLAVFESLSHATAATRTYVVFPIDETDWVSKQPEQSSRVRDECSRHGVGLILVEDIFVKPTAKRIIKAVKREIDHERCNYFLASVLSNSVKERMSTWKH